MNRPSNAAPSLTPIAEDALNAQTLVARISEAEICGFGGGGFSSANKILHALRNDLRCVLVNAVECEPGIECDQWLLTHHGDEVQEAIKALQQALGHPRLILCLGQIHSAIEKDAAAQIEIQRIEPKTPNGEERHLVRRVLGEALSRDQRPSDVGILVLNVGTVLAIGEALKGFTPRRRVVTLPNGPRWVDLGTPLSALLTAPAYQVGGHLTGKVTDGDEVVRQTTNAVWPAAHSSPEPCINCARCDDACPVNLPVAALIRPNLAVERAAALRLDDCFECGLCTPVCPSEINVIAQLRSAKERLANANQATGSAELMRRRSAAHEERLKTSASATAERRNARLARTRQRKW